MSKSVHVFQLQGLTSGIYNIIIKSESLIYSNRIFGTGNGSNALSFSKISEYPAEEIQTTIINKSKSSNTLPYIYGELLLLEAISSEGHKTLKTLILEESHSIHPNQTLDFYFLNCKDADNYMYKIVEIGEHVWMAEDLKTTKYRDKSDIPKINDTDEWVLQNEGAWCYYDNNNAESKLYNWYSVNDTRNICPYGWHIPADYEWMLLETEIGLPQNLLDTSDWRGHDLAWKLKESEEIFWLNNKEVNTNITGFSARANGMRNFAGNFYYKTTNAVYWTSTESNSEYAWCRGLQYDNNGIFREDGRKNMGFSLRCMKNYPPIVETKPVTEVKTNSAMSGGEILDNGGGEIIATGLVWSMDPIFDINNNLSFTENTDLEYDFNNKITQLSANKTYFVKAYATNDAGTGYGEVFNFTTQDDGFGIFTDPRDSITYNIARIGSQIWMTENLKYLPVVYPPIESEDQPLYFVYDYFGFDVLETKLSENYQNYGVLYNWPAAMNVEPSSSSKPSGVRGACPGGWHIPSLSEFETLINVVGGYEVAGGRLKETGTDYWAEPNLGASNSVKFSVRGAGYIEPYSEEDDYFQMLKEISGFWTSELSEIEDYPAAFIVTIFKDSENVMIEDEAPTSIGTSVRCVKDNVLMPSPYNLTLSTSSEEAGVLIGTGEYHSGAYVVVAAIANDGYKFTGWSGDIEFLSSTNYSTAYLVLPENDVNLIANFETDTGGEEESFTDMRDGNTYKTVQIGNQTWMAENLKYLPAVSPSLVESDYNPHYYVYDFEDYNPSMAEETENYQRFGVLYNWHAAEEACPQGWHLPTKTEFDALINEVGGSYVAGANLKEVGTENWKATGINISNGSGFSAIGAGIGSGEFWGLSETTGFWTSTDSNVYEWPTAYSYVLSFYVQEIMGLDLMTKSVGLSVRCVKD
ncbi:MAG: hypothetical protein GX879_03105 [Bacteroidales bacterium]|nr:hypothetical protein [Bacteroidales bacterium]